MRVEVVVRLRVEGLVMVVTGEGRWLLMLLLLLASSIVSGVVLLDERSSFLDSCRYSFL